MDQDLFTNIPSHIIIDILSRLPIPTILRCKSVCKPWLHLLNTHEFATHHLSKSAPGLAVFHFKMTSELYEIYEFEDELHLEHHHLHYKLLTNFTLPSVGTIQGSANGFLVLRHLIQSRRYGLSICNPITREYVEIPTPQEFQHVCAYPQAVTFGFGTSRRTGQYKVVRVFNDGEKNKLLGFPKSECHVYTLGTGSWRSTTASAPFEFSSISTGAFLNGNLHWLVFDSNGKAWISCFDLATELFSVVSPPPLRDRKTLVADVFALGDRLCVCDISSEEEIVVWLMEEYGDEKSWRKDFVIGKVHDDYYGECNVRPIKEFKDGEMAMLWGDFFLFYSSRKTGTVSDIRMFEARGSCSVHLIPHTSSFLSLKRLGMEDVSSL